MPIAIVGVIARDLIKGPLRSLWVVAIALIVWGFVMLIAEAVAKQDRHEKDLNLKDALIIGGTQALALIPGISRSGATISSGLILGLDRVTAARFGFLLGIPALAGAAVLEVPDAISTGGVGLGLTLLGTAVSFGVAYVTVAWMLAFVARHTIRLFVWYRWALAAVLIVALTTGFVTATGVPA
jgi:undecaprenyl-diphosphatase